MFKIGDLVVSKETVEGSLTKGKTYSVLRVNDKHTDIIRIIDDSLNEEGWLMGRFELAKTQVAKSTDVKAGLRFQHSETHKIYRITEINNNKVSLYGETTQRSYDNMYDVEEAIQYINDGSWIVLDNQENPSKEKDMTYNFKVGQVYKNSDGKIRKITKIDEKMIHYDEKMIHYFVEEDGMETCRYLARLVQLAEDYGWKLQGESKHKYQVGDRFAHIDGRLFEIVNMTDDNSFPYEIRKSWEEYSEAYKNINPNVFYLFHGDLTRYSYEGFKHISGPTFKPPVKATPQTCNCHAQITGGFHADYCRVGH